MFRKVLPEEVFDMPCQKVTDPPNLMLAERITPEGIDMDKG